ncbi:MAG TPA: lipocalin-like domain-containing protein [Candidatus Rubrimentiphilum sp.]|nr:lipocalin-like domain-containing protein [Candidatus Rubrimentiphilum sp.]
MNSNISRKVLLGGVASIGLATATEFAGRAAQSAVVGAWKLESFNERVADGSFKPRFGPNPVGYLIYTASGRVSATLSGIHRQALTSGDTSAAAAHCNESVHDFLAYAGTYEIKGSTVFHTIETSVFTNLVGVTLKRGFQLSGDKLVIRTLPPYVWGTQSMLVWRRS